MAPEDSSAAVTPAAAGGGAEVQQPAVDNKSSNSGGGGGGDRLLQSITSRQNVLMQPTITLTMYIPTASVGAVIGRRGQNIANLQKVASQAAATKHPVRVSVIGGQQQENTSSSSTPAGAASSTPSSSVPGGGTESLPYTYSELDFSDPNWTPVVVRADPRAAFVAAQKMEDTVGGAGGVDECVVDVPIARSRHAAIVGKRGATLANLSADTRVRIMVPSKNVRHDVIQLEGDLANVKRCLDRILQVASSAKGGPPVTSVGAGGAAAAGSPTPGKGKPSPSAKQQQQQQQQTAASTDRVQESESVPVRQVQSITLNQLPSQTKLRSIGRKTDTSIKKRKVDGDKWQFTVTGTSLEQVQSAVGLLQKWDDSNSGANANENAGASPPVADDEGQQNSGGGEGGSGGKAAPSSPAQQGVQPSGGGGGGPRRSRGGNKRYYYAKGKRGGGGGRGGG